MAAACDLPEAAAKAKFIMVEDSGVGPDRPFSGEKLSLVLTVYRAKDFEAAKRHVQDILDFQGAGHSVGIHTADPDHARALAEDLKVVRVLVNQAHTFGNGGRSEEHTSELQSLMRISYAVFCLKKKKQQHIVTKPHLTTNNPPLPPPHINPLPNN